MAVYYKSVPNNNQPFKVVYVFEEDCLNLKLLEGDKAWGISVPKSSLEVQATECHVTTENYCNNLEKYLSCLSESVELALEKQTFCIYLILKNKMRKLFFKTPLVELNFAETVYSLLDKLNASSLAYSTELDSVNQKYTSLNQDYEKLEKKMNEFLDRRKEDELSLYNKFIGILNEKKLQIQHLNELLIAFKAGRPTVNPPRPVKSRKPIKRSGRKSSLSPKIKENSDSEKSDTENDNIDDSTTEDEDLPSRKRFANNDSAANLSPQPSTSKMNMDVDPYFIESPESPVPCFNKRIGTVEAERWTPEIKHEVSTPEIKHEEHLSDPITNEKTDRQPRVDFNTQDLLDNL